MCLRSLTVLCGLVLSVAFFANAQNAPGVGSVTVAGRGVKGAEKSIIPLARKRFYIFPGGLSENQALVERIRAAEITSRNCFYSGLQASPCFIAWLKAENCESPFCRPVKRDEIQGVKEFEAAYAKGLATYRNKPDVALSWMINNLPPDLARGYYLHQKGVIKAAIGTQKPAQSIMTTSGGTAMFPGLRVEGKTTKYFISNILPVEIGTKSYVWACEVDVKPTAPTTLALALGTQKKNCVLIEKELRSCTVDACERK